MIVYDFHILSACCCPAEADTELIVDTDTVLTDAVAFKRLKPVARRYAQIIKPPGDFQLAELAPSYGFNVDKSFDPMSTRKRFGVCISERTDHNKYINVLRDGCQCGSG